MAIVRAVKSGNWSDTTVWNTGALPTSADDVYSNTFTVLIDVSPTVLSISNASATGVTVGGGFTISANGVTLTCTATNGLITGNASNSTLLSISLSVGLSCTIVGNCIGGVNSNQSYCVANNSLGTVNIIGNCSGGSANGGHAARNAGGGVINITGNCTGGYPNSSDTYGAVNVSTGTLNITGNCIGGTNVRSYGALNSSTGVVNITGMCISGSPSDSYGVLNSSSGTLIVIGSIQSSGATPGIGPGSTTQMTILSGPFLTSAAGIIPVQATRWFWANSNVTPTYYQIRTANLATIRPLYTADSVGGNPATSNVRSGTVYGPAGELTGTCAVPPAGSVALGVPVDNTTGTATLTAANIRSALGMASANLDTQLAPLTNLDAAVSTRLSAASYQAPLDASGTRTAIGLASANLDTQLDSLPTAVENAQAVRTELSPELDLIDVATSTRLASADYVTPPTSVQNAQAVRTELSPELSNLDSTVSSRLASADYTTPPTPEQNAQAVEIQLSLPLGNLDAAVSSRSTFNPTTDTVAHVTLVDTTTDLTNPPVVPTPEQIATAVRSELEPELSRIDADVTSRLAAADYEQPPTPEQNAEAVRNELTPELERLSNCATVATTGEQIQDAWARSPNV